MTYKRKEIIGDCTLYLGDSLAVLPTLEVQKDWAILTDPPYGLGDTMQGGGWAFKKFDEFIEWDEAPDINFLLELTNYPSIIWGGNYFDLPPCRGFLVWDKQNAVPTMSDCEFAWTNLDRPSKRKSLPCSRRIYGHPTEKPLPLIKWCIEQLPATCTIILDPFMGSGTTLVACAKMGRKGIGIELEPKYFDIACKRVEDAYKQADLFVPRPVPLEYEQSTLLPDLDKGCK